MRGDVAPPQEILAYSATHEAYHVVHADGVHLWYKEAMLGAELLVTWHEFWAKKLKVEIVEATLRQQKLETVSEEPIYLNWGNTKVHALALEKDGYVPAAQAASNDPNVYIRYPARAKRNNHLVPYLASRMQGVQINIREPIAGVRDPPLAAQEAITRALQMAFDGLPEEEKPENKAKLGLFDDFGQHKHNLDNSAHNYSSTMSYERLYLQNTPENSQRASKKVSVGSTEGGKRLGVRYVDEVEACYPFLGIVLGRHELVEDGTAYLNWAERKAQLMAAARADLQPWQVLSHAQGFGVTPLHAQTQLLVVYRLVFKSAEARENYITR